MGGEIVLREPRDTLKSSLGVDAMNLTKDGYLDEDCAIYLCEWCVAS